MTDPDLGTLSPTGNVQAERQWSAVVWVDHTERLTVSGGSAWGLWLLPPVERRVIINETPWVSAWVNDPDQEGAS